MQVNDDEENVLFKWSRCEYTASSDTQDGPKTCIMTGRPATMQCLLPDVTFEINGHEYTHEHAYFASVDEFTKAWPHHKRAKREVHAAQSCAVPLLGATVLCEKPARA